MPIDEADPILPGTQKFADDLASSPTLDGRLRKFIPAAAMREY